MPLAVVSASVVNNLQQTSTEDNRNCAQECLFLAHGIRYVFPAQTGGLVRGVVTGFAAPGLENLIAESGEPVAVWPSAQGSYRGYSLSPLYHRAPEAVQDDPRFHAYLALVDVLRQASPRGRETAVSKLGAMIGRDA